MAETVLDTPVKLKYTNESSQLRQELKDWENAFARAHDGKKPSRDDIKKDSITAAKYKAYNNVRDLLSGRVAQPVREKAPFQAPTPSRKRKSVDAVLPTSYRTPKRLHPARDAPGSRSSRSHPSQIDPYDTPSKLRLLLTPSEKQVIGPTPQRDGHALGLFDLMSEEEPTPLKASQPPIHGRAAFVELLNGGKQAALDPCQGTRHGEQKDATPLSGRKLLDSWGMTPSKSGLRQQGTPSTHRQLDFATPAFLKRDSQSLFNGGEDEEIPSPAPKRPPILATIRQPSKYGSECHAGQSEEDGVRCA